MPDFRMTRRSTMFVTLAAAAAGPVRATDTTLLNVSYDPTRELYREINRAAPERRRVPCWMVCRQTSSRWRWPPTSTHWRGAG